MDSKKTKILYENLAQNWQDSIFLTTNTPMKYLNISL